jgi:hypothetical protein
MIAPSATAFGFDAMAIDGTPSPLSAQRGQVIQVSLVRRQRLLAVQRHRALDARVDDELLAQDGCHGP